MNKVIIVAVMAFCAVELNAQTFQYSRGWTNGKRSGVVTDMPPLRQMMPSPMVQVLTANDLNSRERLIQQIIKNPCEIRMALLNHNVNFNDDYMPADGVDEQEGSRFKRELRNH